MIIVTQEKTFVYCSTYLYNNGHIRGLELGMNGKVTKNHEMRHIVCVSLSSLCTSAPLFSLDLLTNFRCLLIISVSSSVCKGFIVYYRTSFHICSHPSLLTDSAPISQNWSILVSSRGYSMDCLCQGPSHVQSVPAGLYTKIYPQKL